LFFEDYNGLVGKGQQAQSLSFFRPPEGCSNLKAVLPPVDVPDGSTYTTKTLSQAQSTEIMSLKPSWPHKKPQHYDRLHKLSLYFLGHT